jgi:hypothetical protein
MPARPARPPQPTSRAARPGSCRGPGARPSRRRDRSAPTAGASARRASSTRQSTPPRHPFFLRAPERAGQGKSRPFAGYVRASRKYPGFFLPK